MKACELIRKFNCILLVCATSSLFPIQSWAEDAGGDAEASSNDEQVANCGLMLLNIETSDGLDPTYEVVYPPENAGGISISASKAKARMTISKSGTVIYDSGAYKKNKSGLTIKVRGNTSALGAKKPYKLKLQQPADLLFRNDDKFADDEWVLLKDGGSLKTALGLTVNDLVSLQWTPAFVYCNVVLNGQYRGLYLLVEAVKRNPSCRIGVDQETGFICEYDNYWWNEDVYFRPRLCPYVKGITFKYPDPDDIQADQLASVSNAVEAAYADVVAGTYENSLDVNSFARWLLGHDILGTLDGEGSNLYITKTSSAAEDKIAAGNMWDFDSVMGNTNQWSSAHQSGIFWFGFMMTSSNQSFGRAYQAEWTSTRQKLGDTLASFMKNHMSEASVLNVSRIADANLYGTSYETVENELAEIAAWIVNRIVWMDDHVDEMVRSVPEKAHRLVCDANGGFDSACYQVIEGSSAYCDLSWYNVRRSGYTFAGWYTDPVAGEEVYDADGYCVPGIFWGNNKNWQYSGNVTVYAHWKQGEYTLVCDANGGRGTRSLTVVYGGGSFWDISWLGVTKDGVNLAGWFSEPEGGEMVYDADGHSVAGTYWDEYGNWKYAGGTTVYAHWVQNKYTLVCDANGGTGTRSLTVVYGGGSFSDISWLAVAKDGYELTGWYSAAEGGELVYDSNGHCVAGTYWGKWNNWQYAGDVRVYAQWNPLPQSLNTLSCTHACAALPSSQQTCFVGSVYGDDGAIGTFVLDTSARVAEILTTLYDGSVYTFVLRDDTGVYHSSELDADIILSPENTEAYLDCF